MLAEEAAWDKFKDLSPEKKTEVLDFIEFLLQKQNSTAKSQLSADWLQWGAGLHSEIWKGLDTTAFLRQERENWDSK